MLVSLLLMTYNHERFIRRSLESALAQNYEPLEILIWNNCSTDRTDEIIREVLASDKSGHQVDYHVADQNYFPSFLPINTLMRKAKGRYLVAMSGDDASTPNRVAETVKAFDETGAGALSTSSITIDENDNEIGIYHHIDKKPEFKDMFSVWDFVEVGGSPACSGPGLAWHRAVLKRFGPLRDLPRNADFMIPFRGAMVGGNTFIRKPLVYRREHAGNFDLGLTMNRAMDETTRLTIKERSISNVASNWTALRADVVRFAGSYPDELDTDTLLAQIDRRIIGLVGRWTRLRHEMMVSGIGIV